MKRLLPFFIVLFALIPTRAGAQGFYGTMDPYVWNALENMGIDPDSVLKVETFAYIKYELSASGKEYLPRSAWEKAVRDILATRSDQLLLFQGWSDTKPFQSKKQNAPKNRLLGYDRSRPAFDTAVARGKRALLLDPLNDQKVRGFGMWRVTPRPAPVYATKKRVDHVEERVDHAEERVDHIEGHLGLVDSAVGSLGERVARLEGGGVTRNRGISRTSGQGTGSLPWAPEEPSIRAA